MLIRSQDKERCVNFGQVVSVFTTFCKVYFELDMKVDGYCMIGEYSTQEKAIKVIDKIAHNYAFEQTIKNNQSGGGRIILEPFVFQMPEDGDV